MNGVFCAYIDPAIHGIIIPTIFVFSFVSFLWAIFYYAIEGEYDEFAREMAKGLMLWSIMAFIVMVVIWQLVEVVYEWAGIGSGMC